MDAMRTLRIWQYLLVSLFIVISGIFLFMQQYLVLVLFWCILLLFSLGGGWLAVPRYLKRRLLQLLDEHGGQLEYERILQNMSFQHRTCSQTEQKEMIEDLLQSLEDEGLIRIEHGMVHKIS